MSSIWEPSEAQQVPFLRQLGASDADALLARLHRRLVPKLSPVLRAGSAGEDVIVVLEGRVKLVAAGAGGREVVLAIRGAGELIGEMAVLGGMRRTATGVAVDDVEVGSISGEEFRSFIAEHPEVGLVLIRMLVRRLAEADRDRIDLATHDSIGRVAKRLLELAADHGVPAEVGRRIDLSLSQDELASWTGATRETVSRALRLMRALGWIATDRRAITVLDPAALRKRSRDG
ncbi:MAG TPA: Crp/Fnr family transcriptional regulator [Solirubrobacteraceae bacterium]|jgi:CRP-like cAMP-binding protein|nr:Crp/Fnr family transcriptional regulator [Solirubrobacteraceae bacterium]